MSEQAVLSVIRGQEDAIAKGDARANITAMDPDIVVFDLQPPLSYRGEQARDMKG
jgi:ketosteroid isomerase-like protein